MRNAFPRLYEWCQNRVNPLLIMELRSTFKGNTFFFRHVGLLILASIALCVLYAENLADDRAWSGDGLRFFTAVQGCSFLVVLFVVPAFSATAITVEREKLTHELILTTGMSATEIVRGKFLRAMAITALLLLSFLPLVATTFLFGGVTAAQLIRSYIFLLTVSAFVTACSLAWSAMARNTTTAVIATYAFVMFGAICAAGILDGVGENMFLSMYGFKPMVESGGLFDVYHAIPSIFFYTLVLPLYFMTAIASFAMLLAINSLKPIFANRTTNMKIFYLLVTVAGLILFFVGAGTVRHKEATVVALMLMFLSVLSTVFVLEDRSLPVHLVRDITKIADRGRLFRMFYPGMVNGANFVFIVNTFLIVGAMICSLYLRADNLEWTVVIMLALRTFAWMFYWGTTGMAISLTVKRKKIRPYLILTFFVLLLFGFPAIDMIVQGKSPGLFTTISPLALMHGEHFLRKSQDIFTYPVAPIFYLLLGLIQAGIIRWRLKRPAKS